MQNLQSNYFGKRTIVLGMGLSGRSAAEFLLFHGASVLGVDSNADHLSTHAEISYLRQKGLQVCLEKEAVNISHFDFLVLSPGIPHTHPLVQSAMQAGVPIIGEIELGCQAAKNRMVGITGTNGKTTVTLLITHVLQQAGIKAKALGNVSVPLTRELISLDPETIIVLELSSYQIESLFQRCLDTALLLNITPDHLDRYQTMEAYAKAKYDIQRALKPGGHFYLEKKAANEYGHLLNEKIPLLYGYEQSSFIYSDGEHVYRNGKMAFALPQDLKNKKSHDVENLLAAYSACADWGVDGNSFLNGYSTFKKPHHRIQFIAEHQGVCFYDDSKGTNLDAVIRAVHSLDGQIILIAGGVDKGAPYNPWIQEFKGKVKLICAIGQAAGKIRGQIDPQIPVLIFSTLDEAVKHGAQSAQPGEVVLLSPGCSSFDMFKNYEHRGEEFQRIVREITVLGEEK